MASWTDNIDKLTEFKPYVEQFPIEAAVTVGRYKQAQYDQGIQKIQGEIDKVAGIDLVRDVDKNYLQSKLNTLKGDLTKVAAGDFSNYQLVNSVGGMINSIAKDSNVQSAASNTIRYRKEQAYGEQLRKEGKLSPNRQWDFDRATQEWLNNPNVNAQFNGQYKESIDINKKVLDIVKALEPNASIQDIPYALNPDGSINTRVIAAAMQRQGLKEVSEGKIRTAINAALDANDFDELASRGRYNYRNIDKESLKQGISQDYLSTRSRYQQMLSDLKKQKLTASDSLQQAEINKSIEYFESLLGDNKKGLPSLLEQNYLADLQIVDQDPDAVKANLYTKNWMDQVANGFAYREVTNEIVDSPLKEDFWKEKDYNFKVWKENNEELWRGRNFELEKEKVKISREKAEKEGKVGEPVFKRSGDPTLDAINSFENWTNYNRSLDQENDVLLNDLANRNSSFNTKLTTEDIKNRIAEYQNGTYVPKTTAERQKFDRYLQNSTVLSQMGEIYNQIEKEVVNEYQAKSGVKMIPLSEQLKNIPELTVNTPNGQLSYSPKEIYDYLKKEKSKISKGPTAAETIEIDESSLSEKELLLKESISGRYNRQGYGSKVGTTGNKEIDNYFQNLTSKVRENAKIDSNIAGEVAKRLAPLTGDFATEDAPIQYKDTQAEKNFVNTLSSVVVADRQSRTGALGYEPDEVLNMLSEDNIKNVQVSFRRKGPENYVVLTGPDSEQIIPVSSKFVENNSSLGEAYVNKNLEIGQILLRNQGSTNKFKDYDHAYYKATKFGSYDRQGNKSVTLPISADLEEDGGQVFATFKLKTSNLGVLEYPYRFPININDFETKTLPSLTDDIIYKWFLSTLPEGTPLIINGKEVPYNN